DEDIIMAAPHVMRGRTPHRLPEPPAHAVALDRGADLLRRREADPGRPLVVAPARLEHEGGGGNPRSRCHGEELGPSPQALHPRPLRCDQALSRLRPRARRAATTLRPPLVAMRARKP